MMINYVSLDAITQSHQLGSKHSAHFLNLSLLPRHFFLAGMGEKLAGQQGKIEEVGRML